MSTEAQEDAFGTLAHLPRSSGRRDANQTDISSTSHTSSLGEATGETPQNQLKRLLSTTSAISTSSSHAERQQAAVGTNAAFREIGRGSIGRVFEKPGTPWAFKLLLVDRTAKLWNNYVMHLRIQTSFDKLGRLSGQVEIPRVAWFANKSSEFWAEYLNLFPDEPTFRRQPREVLCMERIFPLPESIRHALIDLFCPSNNIAKAKSDPSNKDCIIHPLLGRRRFGGSRPGGSAFFSLRNYKLHVDQIKDLDLDAEEYATSMADALAVLHWHTKIDGNDIEFVLGSSPADYNSVRRAIPLAHVERLQPGTSTYEHTTNMGLNFKKRLISLWIIDFDACNELTMDDAGVKQAVKAFVETEAYCPRPSTGDSYSERLWLIFSHHYIEASAKLVKGTTYHSLPGKFIQGVVEELSRRHEPAAAAIAHTPRRGSQHGFQAGRSRYAGYTTGQGRAGFGGNIQRQDTSGTGHGRGQDRAWYGTNTGGRHTGSVGHVRGQDEHHQEYRPTRPGGFSNRGGRDHLPGSRGSRFLRAMGFGKKSG